MLMDFSSLYITTKMRLTLTCEPHFCYCVSFVLKNVEIAGFPSFHPLKFHIICFRTYEPVHCAGDNGADDDSGFLVKGVNGF